MLAHCARLCLLMGVACVLLGRGIGGIGCIGGIGGIGCMHVLHVPLMRLRSAHNSSNSSNGSSSSHTSAANCTRRQLSLRRTDSSVPYEFFFVIL